MPLIAALRRQRQGKPCDFKTSSGLHKEVEDNRGCTERKRDLVFKKKGISKSPESAETRTLSQHGAGDVVQ